MLKLTSSDITLQQSADNKLDAIKSIAAALTAKGLVVQGYIEGMLNREAQNSTFLGNGIAIPHGTTDTRDLVQNTGVAVHHFPHGVDWGDGNKVYLAIGIAAKSDEHLGILKQLTKVLSADGVETRLQQATTEQEIIALLNGEVQLEADFDAASIQLLFPASDMIQMSAVAGGLIKNSGNAGSPFVADFVTKTPTHLGKGLWLVGSDASVTRTAVSFVTTANDCEYQGTPVKGLLAFGACNNAHQAILTNLTHLVYQGQQETLLSANAEQVIAMLTGESVANTSQEPATSDNTAVFKIKNAHGLHARPGAMLVAEAKKFESTIKVANLDGDRSVVNAKSLMKVIALGVKHGHQLQFTAEGPDASQALEAIGAAIASGLGEG
ncbi:bifunctional PTS system fructose-specific transporter subunit IIA/HPr protein [Vibrio vulnificus]|uniref:fused PTS fructose transporter subunit IIA/HPr protein n=1 Tax=Vibrio vulnificus TaxID=672 RepID=UPI00034DE0BD|nr:fused PTS fructose transporter subunit IIA/HPr protein [Vibrio vulnificus]EWS68369.1 bifunctional PTS system fructose-specific transporter subunit IIA/HPr protein [Vibrio vulnificus BAA87]KFK57904.1 bifunctional PTS system fructose-specific transporter subunit IIA/HPr protein [Vibrio vulnificus]KFK64449.1 bifunctional PTS system fructose-specific transporter subunit IIA/HPr protein [Vibrio vulnificus]KFK70394.1 bifunctional PTS system fructose-specific transporter subunit IIA/HPr protein [Vi